MLRSCEFRRCSEVGRIIPQVFDDISPDDINQGELGNCYYLSAVSALAEFPERIKKCFLTQGSPTDCKYTVRLCIQGQWWDMDLDDYFVWNPATNNWRFSYAKQNEIWVQLLEKAWAKACGSYAKTIGGQTSEALNILTGAPTETLNHSDVTVA